MNYLTELTEIEEKLDKVLNEDQNAILTSLDRQLTYIMRKKKNAEREDKFLRSANQLFNAGSAIMNLSKKFSDKDVKGIINMVGMAMYEVGNNPNP